jgi:two-component system response regulator GlrR
MSDKLVPFRDAKRDFERQYCQKALEISNGNIAVAARLADKDRRSFYELMHRSGVRKKGSSRNTPGPKPYAGRRHE